MIDYVTDPVADAGAACRDRSGRRSASRSISATTGVTTTTSIGIAIAPRGGADSDEILRSADLALYSAKSGGRGSFRFFEPELDRLLQARRSARARNAQRARQRRVRAALSALHQRRER